MWQKIGLWPGLSPALSHSSRDKVKKLSEARESIYLKDYLGNGFLHPGLQGCELLRLAHTALSVLLCTCNAQRKKTHCYFKNQLVCFFDSFQHIQSLCRAPGAAVLSRPCLNESKTWQLLVNWQQKDTECRRTTGGENCSTKDLSQVSRAFLDPQRAQIW